MLEVRNQAWELDRLGDQDKFQQVITDKTIQDKMTAAQRKNNHLKIIATPEEELKQPKSKCK